MTNKQIENILFDSEINKWNVDDSEFDEKLRGKRDIIILIEDERQNLFGGYIGNRIKIDEKVKDETCYVFSLRKDGEYTMKQYLKNEIGYSYWIGDDSSDCFMVFGVSDDTNGRDITVYKKESSSGYCKQECYEYSREPFALTGKHDFNIKRIVVYQLQ